MRSPLTIERDMTDLPKRVQSLLMLYGVDAVWSTSQHCWMLKRSCRVIWRDYTTVASDAPIDSWILACKEVSTYD